MTAAPRPFIRRWAAPAAVVVVAALTRLWALGHPDSLVFDETYYVKDAVTLMNLGYEGSWPEGANEAFNSGDVDGFSASPSFVAHPPLGKWIIAAGLAVFGADDSVGWRISVAIAGILLVVLTMAVARRLFRSMLLTTIAGGLLAIDGNAIVLSRVALLDTPLALLCLLGAFFVLLDRSWARARQTAWAAGVDGTARDGTARDGTARDGTGREWGPVLWWRPWLLAAAVAFGLASGVKWSALYFLAVFGVYTVVSDALLRRQAGVAFWGSSAVLRQGPVNALLLVPLAFAVHLLTWAGWFVTDGGYHRHWVEEGGEAWSGALAWVPIAFQNWWHYQAGVYAYHIGETTPHGYQAHPLTWLLLIRPTSMHYEEYGDGTGAEILDLGNPLIWWAGAAALVAVAVRLVLGLVRRRRVAVEAFILTGIAAGYLPWLLYPSRTVFQFYTIAFEPFLVLALTLVIGVLLRPPGTPPGRVDRPAAWLVGGFLVGCLILSAYFWPIWTGQPIPLWFLRSHFWLPTWV